MAGQPEPVTPLVYEVVEPTTQQTTVIDVVLGAFAVVGVLGLVALLLGLSLAAVLIGVRKMRGEDIQGTAGGGATRLGLGASGHQEPAP